MYQCCALRISIDIKRARFPNKSASRDRRSGSPPFLFLFPPFPAAAAQSVRFELRRSQIRPQRARPRWRLEIGIDVRIDIGIDMDGAQAEPPPPPPLERHREAEADALTERTSILTRTFRCHSNSTARSSAPPQRCDVPPWARLDLHRAVVEES